MKLHTIVFFLILVFFFLKGIFYIFYIPPWEAPDEPGHVNYIFYLYHNHKLPDASIAPVLTRSIISSWNYQKKYLLPNLQKHQNIKLRQLFNRNSYDKEQSLSNITQYPPLYYLYLLPFLILSLHFSSYITYILLCFGSLLLGIVSLVVLFKIFQLLFPKFSYLPHLGIFLIALDPMWTFIHSVINNDAMMIVFFLGFVYLTLRYVLLEKKLKIVSLLLIALFVGIGTLVKPQLLILSLIYLITIFIQFENKISWKKYTYILVSAICIPLLWYGWKYFQQGSNSLSYAFVSKQSHAVNILQYPIQFLKMKEPTGIFMTFWGFFGWLDVSMPKYMYVLFALVIGIAVVGWLLKRTRENFSKIQRATLPFFIITTLFYISFVFLYDIFFFAKGGHFGIQGRYFLPLLPILFFVILRGVLFYGRRLRIVLFSFILGVFILSQILMYTSISKAYYYGYYVVSPLTSAYIK